MPTNYIDKKQVVLEFEDNYFRRLMFHTVKVAGTFGDLSVIVRVSAFFNGYETKERVEVIDHNMTDVFFGLVANTADILRNGKVKQELPGLINVYWE